MGQIKLYKRYQLQRRVDLLCDSGGRIRNPGYIGKVDCANSMNLYKMRARWQGRYPNPMKGCGGGDRSKDSRCAELAPGATHPGLVMISDWLYALNIDIP